MRTNKVQVTVEKLEYICEICDAKFDGAYSAGIHYRNQHSYTVYQFNLMPSEKQEDHKVFWFVPDQDRFHRLVDGQNLITYPCSGTWSGPGWYYFKSTYSSSECGKICSYIENITNILAEKEKQLEIINKDIKYLKGLINDN